MTPSSTVEFLLLLLMIASAIAVVALRLRIPYTVALVLAGLALGSVHVKALEGAYLGQHPNWLTPNVILILFLPGLLFEGSAQINFRRLRQDLGPVLILANVGVLATTVFIGYVLHWAMGLPLLVAMLFGAIISATDPISVLAIFKELSLSKRLSMLVESESLLNDGTAAVLFQVLLAGAVTGQLRIWSGAEHFFTEVFGGAGIGLALGYLMSFITKQIDDPQIEITLTTILAYGSYMLANQLHASGVLATVIAGITVGNVGAKLGMSVRTRIALSAFWEYFAFVLNSILFLLIGIEVRVGQLLRRWPVILLAIGTVLVGRALAVYGLVPLSNLFSRKIPMRWRHVLVWGGLHGGLSLALALSLSEDFRYRQDVLAFTFGVVAFSIVVQGLTMKPLLRVLKITATSATDDAVSHVEQVAVSSALVELDQMLRARSISEPVYKALRSELRDKTKDLGAQIEKLNEWDGARASSEMHAAWMRLSIAVRHVVNLAIRDGEISPEAGAQMIDDMERQLGKIVWNHRSESAS